MQREKVFSVITIICFASVVFIPIGLVLMAYFTKWPRKRKIIIGAVTTGLYVLIAVLLMNLKPAYNSSGISLPGSYEQGATDFDSSSKKSKSKFDPNGDYELVEGVGDFEIENPEDLKEKEITSTMKKTERKKNTKWLFPLIFFLVMLFIIIIQNIKNGKKNTGYDNPYVDVKKYKIPIPDDFKFPTVHFLRLNLHSGENYLYATETTQKDNPGNFVITNERVVIYNKENNVSYKISELSLASSVSNNVMMIAAGNEKNYIFLPDNQMKYALAIVRFAYKKYGN